MLFYFWDLDNHDNGNIAKILVTTCELFLCTNNINCTIKSNPQNLMKKHAKKEKGVMV